MMKLGGEGANGIKERCMYGWMLESRNSTEKNKNGYENKNKVKQLISIAMREVEDGLVELKNCLHRMFT